MEPQAPHETRQEPLCRTHGLEREMRDGMDRTAAKPERFLAQEAAEIHMLEDEAPLCRVGIEPRSVWLEEARAPAPFEHEETDVAEEECEGGKDAIEGKRHG